MIPCYATEMWACSKKAGEWLYGNIMKFSVIPNAINTEKYQYSEVKRMQLRKQLGISDDDFIIGHVGRMSYQKNHEFLIKLFAEMVKANDRARLMLIGDGELRSQIEKQILEYGLENKVLLLGQRKDVAELLNAMDLFLLPSHFEGLPVVAVEAQTNGLSCICSTNVPEETNITGNVSFLSLEAPINAWVEKINIRTKRDGNSVQKIIDNGYEIKAAAELLTEKYLQLLSMTK
jgi:glycosyltransferase involved in cell wall biosynthesis